MGQKRNLRIFESYEKVPHIHLLETAKAGLRRKFIHLYLKRMVLKI